MLVFNSEDKKIILTNNKDINLQEYALDEILKSLRVSGKYFKVIDLRFDKPIVEL